MKNSNFKFMLSVLAVLLIVSSCKKDDGDPQTEQENIESANLMSASLSSMAAYNDSMIHAGSHHEMLEHDELYHHHDSVYNHHHQVYHHGDTTHHHSGWHHTPEHHHIHDSITQIHHGIVH